MPITIHSERECEQLRAAGRAAAASLAGVAGILKPGVATAEIDAWIRADTERRGGRPSQLGYHGFPAAVCTSRNQVVCHGIPSATEFLEGGDVINVDVTTELNGFHGDTSRTFVVGRPSVDAAHLVETAERCLYAGISTIRAGVRLGAVGEAISRLAVKEGCSIVHDYGGHGIGRKMHLPPHVPHHGIASQGPRLRAGMAITIEPMLNLGTPEVELLQDGWTVVTRDGKWSAQFEHSVLVHNDGCEILTLAP